MRITSSDTFRQRRLIGSRINHVIPEEKNGLNRKLLALIRLPAEKVNFPLKNKKSIGISGSRQEEPTIRVERNGLRVGGDAEKPCIMETSQNEFYEERKGRVSVLQRAQVTKGQDVKRK